MDCMLLGWSRLFRQESHYEHAYTGSLVITYPPAAQETLMHFSISEETTSVKSCGEEENSTAAHGEGNWFRGTNQITAGVYGSDNE